MTEREVSVGDYYSKYEMMANDIRAGMDEGFNEGFREGIKQGFVAGVRECFVTGFNDIDVKGMEEILKDAFETASDEAIRIKVRRTASNEYKEKISPSFKKKMEEACNKAVEEIKDVDFELEEQSASELKDSVGISVKKVRECIGNAFRGAKKKLPTYVIFRLFFDTLQEEFNRDLDENLEACEKRICKEIDNKIDCRKACHE